VPMVGRERELDVLRGAFAEASESHACRFVTIVGAAGVGKSRLVAEFLGGLDGEDRGGDPHRHEHQQ